MKYGWHFLVHTTSCGLPSDSNIIASICSFVCIRPLPPKITSLRQHYTLISYSSHSTLHINEKKNPSNISHYIREFNIKITILKTRNDSQSQASGATPEDELHCNEGNSAMVIIPARSITFGLSGNLCREPRQKRPRPAYCIIIVDEHYITGFHAPVVKIGNYSISWLCHPIKMRHSRIRECHRRRGKTMVLAPYYCSALPRPPLSCTPLPPPEVTAPQAAER